MDRCNVRFTDNPGPLEVAILEHCESGRLSGVIEIEHDLSIDVPEEIAVMALRKNFLPVLSGLLIEQAFAIAGDLHERVAIQLICAHDGVAVMRVGTGNPAHWWPEVGPAVLLGDRTNDIIPQHQAVRAARHDDDTVASVVGEQISPEAGAHSTMREV